MDSCSRILCAVTFSLLLLSMAGCVSQEEEMKVRDLEQRVATLKEQNAKLEQLAGKLETENATRAAQMRESLSAQDAKNRADRDQIRDGVNTRLDEINGQLEQLRKDILDAVQKTNTAFGKTVDARFDSLDVVIGTILLRIEELEKRPQSSKK